MNNYSSANMRRGQIGYAKMQYRESVHPCISALPDDPVVAMAYVPFQTDSSTYDEMKAIKLGTLYPVLYKPFMGRGAR